MGTWDGLWPELMAGALSGLVVFGGIRWTQHLNDKSDNTRYRYEASALLVQEISNLTDKATRSKERLRPVRQAEVRHPF
jgi:hypothetical protein